MITQAIFWEYKLPDYFKKPKIKPGIVVCGGRKYIVDNKGTWKKDKTKCSLKN